MSTKICAAWNQNTNIRCPNSVEGKSLHCSNCRPGALKLYLNYKSLCEKADKMVIDLPIENRRRKVKHLRKCHNALVNAYDARMQYRNVAIAPELHDFGHNLQFQLIQEKIDKCVDLLNSIRTNEYKNIIEDDVYDLDKSNDDESEEIDNVVREFEDFARKRRRDNEETERILARYMKESKAEHRKKDRAVNSIIKLTKGLSKTEDVGINIMVLGLNYTFYKNNDIKVSAPCDCCSIAELWHPMDKIHTKRWTTLASAFETTTVHAAIFQNNFILSNLKHLKHMTELFFTFYKTYSDVRLDIETKIEEDVSQIIDTDENNQKRIVKHLTEKAVRDKSFGSLVESAVPTKSIISDGVKYKLFGETTS